MKKENFVETNEESKGTLDELIRAHDANNDAHGALRSVIDLGLLAHKGDFDLHVSETEREAWNKAADAAEEIGKAESYATRAETAEKGAESARASAQEAYRLAIGEKSDAAKYAGNAEAAEKRVVSYIDDAKGIRDDVKGYADSAKREADNAASESQRARLYANRAGEVFGNASGYAKRAEDAAKKAEELAEESGHRIDDLQELTIGPLAEKVEGLGNAIGAVTSTVGGKANPGQTLASMKELEALPLPGDVSEGVVYTVVEKVPNKPCLLVAGKFSDCFSDSYGDGVYYEIELGSTYSEYFMKDGWVVDAGGYGTYVYNADDYSYVGAFSNGVASGCEVTNLHGYRGNPTDEVSFYICSEEGLEVSQKELAFYYNGNEWVELAAASAIGDIDAALDAILAMDEKLLGGDA